MLMHTSGIHYAHWVHLSEGVTSTLAIWSIYSVTMAMRDAIEIRYVCKIVIIEIITHISECSFRVRNDENHD
jgi:hypothetical protein